MSYNINRIFEINQGETIKNQDILHIISEISETLSLTSRPEQLLETSLDTLSEVLGADCCWVQMVKPGSGRVELAACRGFTDEIHREMASLDMEHLFCHEVVGLGQKIVIPDLNRDGKYNIPIFVNSGFSRLFAVPVMTYRVHGILGVACRPGVKPGRDYPELLAVIAKLIGMSLSKAMLEEITSGDSARLYPDDKNGDTETEPVKPVNPKPQYPQSPAGEKFHDHARRMRAFSQSHQL